MRTALDATHEITWETPVCLFDQFEISQATTSISFQLRSVLARFFGLRVVMEVDEAQRGGGPAGKPRVSRPLPWQCWFGRPVLHALGPYGGAPALRRGARSKPALEADVTRAQRKPYCRCLGKGEQAGLTLTKQAGLKPPPLFFLQASHCP